MVTCSSLHCSSELGNFIDVNACQLEASDYDNLFVGRMNLSVGLMEISQCNISYCVNPTLESDDLNARTPKFPSKVSKSERFNVTFYFAA